MKRGVSIASLTATDAAPAAEVRKRLRRRRSRPRAATITLKTMLRGDADKSNADRVDELAAIDDLRPRTRGECLGGERPCPWVSCRHHLYLDVNPDTGSIKINFPDVELSEMAESCVLDVTERGGITLEEIGEVMNLTRERIRQVEVHGLLKLKMGSPSPDELGADLLAPIVRGGKA